MGPEPALLAFSCPRCGQDAVVRQVQGDHCPGCGAEFKRFAPGEDLAAWDFFRVLTGKKHLLKLPDGYVVIAHT